MSVIGVSQNSSWNNSSVASLHLGEDMEISQVKTFVKELLKSRIFLGRYIERRLVDANVGYRDIVLISAAETELKRDILLVQHKLRLVTSQWIGITDAVLFDHGPSEICLWTEIENQPFGAFWFQIKSIRFRDEEIIILLKCIRQITDAYLEVEPILTGKKNISKQCSNKPDVSLVALDDTYKEIVETLKSALSIRNVKEFITFFFAFAIAIFTGSTAFINFVGNFVLALIREMSIFVKNSTPMFLGILDFFSKLVGGFYILLAMFFRPSNPNMPINKRSLHYDRPTSSSQRHREYDGSFD